MDVVEDDDAEEEFYSTPETDGVSPTKRQRFDPFSALYPRRRS